MLNYILASASPRRKELLKRIIDEFEVVTSEFDERAVQFNSSIEEYVEELALGKARDVSSKVTEDSIIIAADTIVVIEGKILGKPKDDLDAYNMLRLLSNNIHEVYTGVVVINMNNNKIFKSVEKTKVKFSELSEDDIRGYIETGEPRDKAAAYGIQGKGGVFVEKIEGCFYNVVGLPLNRLRKMLLEII